tara:strand:+ start:968 stop:1711 length:744 start_codon:yes stop_codon:yes gene_type:complete
MKDLFTVKDKNIIITGGSQGIGLALAKGFDNNGANVIVLDKKNSSKLPNSVSFYKADISSTKKINNIFSKIVKNHHTIDVLINNAGITISNNILKYKTSDWNKTFDTNVKAVFQLSKLCSANMIKSKIKGSIINVISIGAFSGFPNNPAYTSSKSALRNLTKSMAMDLSIYGIRVNNLVPGYTKTPMNIKSWNNKLKNKQRASKTMLGRWALPEEMLGPSLFLASEASNYVTGIDLIVDGGWLSKGI